MTSPQSFKIIRDLSGNTLQVGPFGTILNKVTVYPVTLTLPPITGFTEVLLTGIVCPSAAVGDSLSISNLAAVPAGVILTGAYVTAPGLVTIKAINSVAATSSGATLAATITGVTPALNI
jgi:hypothetical protein